MPREIERKFVVTGEGWRDHVTDTKQIRQTYLAATDRAQIRVRIVDGSDARLTIKSAGSDIERAEYEYEIPVDEAKAMFALATCGSIEKRRHIVPAAPHGEWEIDEFSGRHEGLVLAEIELAQADDELSLPDWCGAEVTGDGRYYNVNLATH
ncbi:CYTH domain-containing protein [Erythrobacter sp.]|uniref:CYTH domain-containing protein n=1 Tax=Erythrobacter sp. TaxID=1042 RepID=UPI003C786CF7